jgi:signal transduction histidine kinase/ActR/RegA family two-component response regulator
MVHVATDPSPAHAEAREKEALLTAEALQSAILNSANFSSIATDAKGVIQIFNIGAERMLGYTAADVKDRVTPAEISDPQEIIARAKTLSATFGTEIKPGFEALVFKASREIEDIYELTYIRKDGSRFPAVVSVTALRDATQSIIGYLLIGTDNTARARVEEERNRLDLALREKNKELESAKSVAERANLAKSAFLSSMSHELRSPLNAIIGFAQLMESDSPPPNASQQASIDQVLHAGWYLLALINEILDLATIESGRLTLSLEPVLLGEVLLECQDMIAPQAAKHGVTTHFESLPVMLAVNADRTRLKQVLINLLSNAVKYNGPHGRVTVIATQPDERLVRITVRDTGDGLDADHLSQLFQPFNRLGREEGGLEGTGIGLVVSKRLTELMNGRIGVQSKVGTGSEFWIELQLSVAPVMLGPDVVASALEPTAAQQADTMVHTVLYVEDNPANLTLVERLVERRPELRLISATDALRGVALARSAIPDVILMDINLSGPSGFDALRLLGDHSETSRIPVIALSANAMPRDIARGLEAGFFRYLTKPVRAPDLFAAIAEAIVLVDARRTGAVAVITT